MLLTGWCSNTYLYHALLAHRSLQGRPHFSRYAVGRRAIVGLEGWQRVEVRVGTEELLSVWRKGSLEGEQGGRGRGRGRAHEGVFMGRRQKGGKGRG
ncbi:hypothetical protein E2C01_092776 [Portunus trituberculatus]|uniref:Uncharacterized protein n=1 Tax=Portunus trituberculatus TaxID=210409 RepID=A0A5B7JRI3_PORTR|nr:hypothetical protein [Portunus trituberculatus]